nr:tRNA (adenine(22)-N(1))-methyltransferase TrmK [Pullulanibacillus pueri]
MSERLLKVATFIPENARLADIGSDHAYLPCYAALNNLIKKGIAGEINEGPYRSATETVLAYRLEDKIEVRQGDGLSVIQASDKINTIVIAGMGGELIRSILEKGKEKLTEDTCLILQPNVGEKTLREWLVSEQWDIINEVILKEEGHIYEIIVAHKTASPKTLTLKDLWFGPFNRKAASEVFKEKWMSERDKRLMILESLSKAKSHEEAIEAKKQKVNDEIRLIEEVLAE